MAKELDPIVRLAMEGRVLALDLVQSVVRALPGQARQLSLSWLASDLDVLDRCNPEQVSDTDVWRRLMDDDPRKAREGC